MSTPKSRARWVRGVLVGLCSAVVTVGAHAAAGGLVPQGGRLVIAMIVCATVGAALATAPLEVRRDRLFGVIGALIVAQSVGHLTLMASAGHQHDHGGVLGATPSMTGAHLAAAVILGIAISSVEYLYVVCASVLCWLRVFAAPTSRPAVRSLPPASDDVRAQSVLRCSGLGMRAPPQLAAPTA
ncbi:hypothetical protein H7J93_17435 [Mycobacterium barrassiae]|uniref:hypothetical protein n=1 Tax=Mycobacterium barrassiae TaxID=319709 RepID=UPI002265D72A|nr:hypothetical protein [Mycobacterium barrassiae]MCV7301404.1 hypothetical protein [Mycobacterium barrassiae]